jgi:hypothetical protein
MTLRFNVLDDELVIDGESFLARDNPHEVKSPKKQLARAVGSAHHAGAAEVLDGLVDDHVQSQEDGEKAYAEAQGTWVPPKPRPDGTIEPGRWAGPWGEANQAQGTLDAAAKATVVIDTEEGDG